MTESGQYISVDLDTPTSVHIVGIGGAGMRSIANVLADMGHDVSGSDLKYSPGLDQLKSKGIKVAIGHSQSNFENPKILTKSTAIPEGNPEVTAALEAGTPVLTRAQIMAVITAKKKSIVVAGTHGKTTTSSILSVLLSAADIEPSFLIGGDLNEIGCGALWNRTSDVLVVEGDESDGSFLELDSDISIITSVESDHLAYYKDDSKLKEAFREFATSTKGLVYLYGDSPETQYLKGLPNIRTYGEAPNSTYQIKNYEGKRFASTFEIVNEGKVIANFDLASPGFHNALNATAAVAVAVDLGLSTEKIKRGISQFAGVARRFQYRGEINGISFIDDYAHLPTEVESALEAAKAGKWNRVVAVFQPHRFTRTNDLAPAFSDCFRDADEVIITGIYSAGEKAIPGVTGKLVADAVALKATDQNVRYCEHREDLIMLLQELLVDGDLCLTLGAGDLTNIADQLMGALEDG
tara:strand:+ start:1083 stop:2480 length:1398 start_codon:yes stop_codon:yes gene_type:complete